MEGSIAFKNNISLFKNIQVIINWRCQQNQCPIFSGDFISYGKLGQGLIIEIMKASGTLRIQTYKDINTNI